MVYMHLAGGSWWFHNLMILEEMTRIRFGGMEVVYVCLIDEEFVWSACAASPHLLQDKSFHVREGEVGRREVVCREGLDEEMRIWGWGNLRVRDELFPTMSLTVSRSYILPVLGTRSPHKLSSRSSSEPWHFCGYWSLEPATGSYWEQISRGQTRPSGRNSSTTTTATPCKRWLWQKDQEFCKTSVSPFQQQQCNQKFIRMKGPLFFRDHFQKLPDV